MGAISIYRGHLHRVPKFPRRWPMPPRVLSLRHFRLLIRKRSEALARLLPADATTTTATTSQQAVEEEEEEEKGKDEDMGDNGCPKPEAGAPVHLAPPDSISQPKIGEDVKQGEPLQEPIRVDAATPNPPTGSDAKMEVSNNLDTVKDIEDRKIEVEKKLQVLNEKKHHLVQMLKQILHAEEEIKKRSIQSPGLRAYVPVHAENAGDMGSVTRHVQTLSVDVNFGGDLGGEAVATPNQNIHPFSLHPMHTTSPSAASLVRPTNVSLQHNTVLHNPRSSSVAAGQRPTTSNPMMTTMMGSPPSRLGPTATHHGHTSSLPPVSVAGAQFNPSTPSPASGSASSVFRDSRLTSSS